LVPGGISQRIAELNTLAVPISACVKKMEAGPVNADLLESGKAQPPLVEQVCFVMPTTIVPLMFLKWRHVNQNELLLSTRFMPTATPVDTKLGKEPPYLGGTGQKAKLNALELVLKAPVSAYERLPTQ
jgi:hypothetical protein